MKNLKLKLLLWMAHLSAFMEELAEQLQSDKRQ